MKPTHFTSLEQIISTRPAFDMACIITVENFADLAGDYNFKTDALCQVESIEAQGKPCKTKHRHGYLGIRSDGKEGLIGSTCGPKYFKNHKGFAARAAFVRRELQLDDLTERLHSIEADETFLPKTEQLRERLRVVTEESQALIKSLPEDVAARLRAMVKAGTADLRIEVEFIEKVEDERTGKIHDKAKWVPQTIGSIAGMNIAERSQIRALRNGLHAVRVAFESIDANRNLGNTKLLKQLKLLEALPNMERQVIAFETAWVAFARPQNVNNFWLLSRRQDSQQACMRVAAAAAGLSTPSNRQVNASIRDAEAVLRTANGNRRIRPEGF